ncbi:MAG: DUF1800 family protein [Fimbriimonadaceae bacterium]
MNPSRRDLLRWSIGLGAVAAASGCAQTARRYTGVHRDVILSLPADTSPREVRIAKRLSFGPRPAEVERIREIGQAAYVDELLQADRSEPAHLTLALNRLDAMRMHSRDLRDLVPHDQVRRQLQQAVLLSAVYGANPLLERMVDFWTDHFNLYGRKDGSEYRISRDYLTVVRAHALGSFPSMLQAGAKSPAMLAYLDNHRNVKGVPNENYARELMELHTLGVDGGYTQRDVQEVARCFTGWSVENRFLRPADTFVFHAAQHDDGEKIVLGHRIPPGGGQRDGERVLEILAQHPSTARFLATKLCRYFLGQPDQTVVEASSEAYLASDGDLKATLRPILTGETLASGPPIAQRPLDFVVASLRGLQANFDGAGPILDRLDGMGNLPYEWPMPDGYPTETEAWTGSLLGRWNFATALVEGRIPGVEIEWERWNERTLRDNLLIPADADPLAILEGADRTDLKLTAALLISSPQFQWR